MVERPLDREIPGIYREKFYNTQFHSPVLHELFLNEHKEEQVKRVFLETLNAPFTVVNYGQRMLWQDYIEDFSTRKAGTCSPKHYYLGAQLEAMGIPVIYVDTPFLWRELPVDYPNEVRVLAEEMPTQHHLSLLANLDGHWQVVDATWDRPLGRVGFTIPQENHELETSILAVIPRGEQVFHCSAKERFSWVENLRKTMPYSKIPAQFYFKLNSWLQEIRQKGV